MTIWTLDLRKHQGPRYRAIAEALAGDIDSGRLEPGMRLPTHRDLADRLGVTVGTVSRAYAEADRPGLSSLLEYQPHAGSMRHRAAGAAWLGRAGLQAHPDQVMVTSGAQHAMAIIFATMAGPGDVVLTERFTYPGVKTLAGLLHLEL